MLIWACRSKNYCYLRRTQVPIQFASHWSRPFLHFNGEMAFLFRNFVHSRRAHLCSEPLFWSERGELYLLPICHESHDPDSNTGTFSFASVHLLLCFELSVGSHGNAALAGCVRKYSTERTGQCKLIGECAPGVHFRTHPLSLSLPLPHECFRSPFVFNPFLTLNVH